MSKKAPLFLLIKSLTKAEKRYFKIFAANQKGDSQKNNNYLLLFDAIDKQKAYDEQAIKVQFVKYNFVKQLHVTKNYLSQLILKSLRNFHSKLSKEAELKDLLRDIEILFHKELYDQCHQLIAKAYDMANEYEKLPTLLDINTWKRRLHLALSSSVNRRPQLNTLLEENADYLQKLNHLHHYWHQSINLMTHLSNPTYREEFMMQKWFKDEKMANTIQAKKLYYHIKMGYQIMVEKKPSLALQTIDRLICTLEAHPKHIREDIGSYLTALNNKVGLLLDVKLYDQILPLLHKIRKAPETYRVKEITSTSLKVQLQTYNVELELYRDTNQVSIGIGLITEVASFLTKFYSRVPDDYLLCFYYQFAYLYFKEESYSKALEWLNKILDTKFNTQRKDLESYARFLYLIIHFELGNIMLLKYAVESCRRFLKKHQQQLETFEKVLLRFFSQLCTCPTNQYTTLFAKLQKELFRDSAPSDRLKHLDYLDFATWIAENMAKR